MIDLHMHSKYSQDGSEEIEYILDEAEKLGLKCISITDHNTCRAYDDLKNERVRNRFSGQIITGVELNTKVLGVPIEILGYNINPEKMQKLLEETYMPIDKRNKIELERLYQKAVDAGIILPSDFIEQYDGKTYCSKYFHSVLIKEDTNKKFVNENAWKDYMTFYREYMGNPKTQFYVDVDDLLPSFDVALGIIKQAGGMVFLPHIYEYRDNSERILNYILENYKIDGIECYYRNFTEEQTNYLLKVCDEHHLYISGGSDFHGTAKPYIKLGTGEGNLNVPDEIIDSWKRVVI